MASEAAAETRTALIDLLAHAGTELPPGLKAAIVARVPSPVPELITIVEDEALAQTSAPGGGWVPAHAVELLIELRAENAITPLLAAMARGKAGDLLTQKIAANLPKLGQAVLEPTLQLLETTQAETTRGLLVTLSAQLGVRDDRVFALCAAAFERYPTWGATLFGDYGDERALPLLRRAIERFEPKWEKSYGAQELTDFTDAYRRIAGAVPGDLAERAAALQGEHAKRYEEELQRIRGVMAESAAKGLAREQVQAGSAKVGRNDACSCGSGKKYKKCCGVGV